MSRDPEDGQAFALLATLVAAGVVTGFAVWLALTFLGWVF